MYATLLIPGPGEEERVLLPEEAVQRVGAGEVVFVEEKSGRYRAVPVQASPAGEGLLTVAGVAEGVRVVTRGAYTLRCMLEGIEVE